MTPLLLVLLAASGPLTVAVPDLQTSKVPSELGPQLAEALKKELRVQAVKITEQLGLAEVVINGSVTQAENGAGLEVKLNWVSATDGVGLITVHHTVPNVETALVMLERETPRWLWEVYGTLRPSQKFLAKRTSLQALAVLPGLAAVGAGAAGVYFLSKAFEVSARLRSSQETFTLTQARALAGSGRFNEILSATMFAVAAVMAVATVAVVVLGEGQEPALVVAPTAEGGMLVWNLKF